LRRENIDLSYKDRTANIISNIYNQWQLPYHNNREFTHILANRLVSITEDLYSEIEYVENMFFPDAMDINEEWLLYEALGPISASDILINGEAINIQLTSAKSIDELISGPYDHFDVITSGDMNFNIIHACTSGTNIVFLADNNIHRYNNNTNVITTSQSYNILSGETTLYVTIGNVDFPFMDEIENIIIKDTNDNIISYEYIDRSSCNGNYIQSYDVDNNGVINKKELILLQEHKNKTSYDYTPEEWDKLKWMDIDGDGTIGQADYTYLSSIIPSMKGDIKSCITLPVNSVGTYYVTYEIKVEKPTLVISSYGQYKIFYDTDEISKLYSKIIFDEATQILYGISKKDKLLYAIRVDSDFSILSTSRLFVNTGLEKHTITDVAIHNGYIFVLTEYNSNYYIFYEDSRKEFLEYIDRKGKIILDSYTKITGLLIDQTGYFYLHNDRFLFKIKAHRNKFLEMNDTVYFNIDYPITNLSGDPIILLPWTVFNSFDSFAYSFGIERPAGCNNIKMKELIYDFWKYQQSNTAIGINYGIKRELGLTNTPKSFETVQYILPAPIDLNNGSEYCKIIW